MSTDHERSYLAARYPSYKFRKKLRKMGDSQVLAIYHKVKKKEAEEAAKKKESQRDADTPF